MLIAFIYFTTRQKWAHVLKKKKYPENENYYRKWTITTDLRLKSPRNGFLQKKDKMGPPPEKFTEKENYYRKWTITTEPCLKNPRNGFLQKKDKMGTAPKMDCVTPDKMGPAPETKNMQKMKITIENGTIQPK